MRRMPRNFHSQEHGGVPPPRFTLTAPARGLFGLVRTPLGYEMLHPVRVIVRALLLLVMPPVLWFLLGMLTHQPPPDNEGRDYLYAYAAVMFAVTLLRFAGRAMQQGCEVHSCEAGHSVLTWLLPLPVSFMEQLVVPGLLGWAGWEIAHDFSADLGIWLMICAASYTLVANWEMRCRMAQRRAIADGKTRATVFAVNVDAHEEQVVKATTRKQKGKASPVYGAGDMPQVAELGQGRRSR